MADDTKTIDEKIAELRKELTGLTFMKMEAEDWMNVFSPESHEYQGYEDTTMLCDSEEDRILEEIDRLEELKRTQE